jgi:hypothetical protein
MKAIASILCLYLFGLFVQPVFFPLHTPKAKVMNCCKNNKTNTHKGCSDNEDGCGNNQCNPFASQCPICAANALVVAHYVLPQSGSVFFTSPDFFLKNHQAISQYCADILHPPRVV